MIFIISIILMLIGLAGVILPFLPGVPVTWLGMLLYAYDTNFAELSKMTVAIFLALTIASVLLEFILPLVGAKQYKATKQGILGAALGLILGPLVLNAPGIVLGPLIGAIAGEYLAGKEQQAWRSGFGVFVGFMVSLVLRVVLVLVMIGYVVVAML